MSSKQLEIEVENSVDLIRAQLREGRIPVVVGVYGLSDRARDLVTGRLHTQVFQAGYVVNSTPRIPPYRLNAQVIIVDIAGFNSRGIKSDINIFTSEGKPELIEGDYHVKIVVPKLKPGKKEICRGYFGDPDEEIFGPPDPI